MYSWNTKHINPLRTVLAAWEPPWGPQRGKFLARAHTIGDMAERAYQATQNAVNALENGTEMPPLAPPSPNEINYPGIRIYLGKDASGKEVVRKLEVIPRQ